MNELEHNWCGQQLAAYLADGLSEAERARFEAHVHECDACTRELEDARGMEANLRALFAPVAPAEDFEDRMVQRLRQRGMQRRKPLHPLVRRAAIAAAAAIALGSVGYISQRAIQDNGLISPEQIVGTVRGLNERIEQIALQTPTTGPATRPSPQSVPDLVADANQRIADGKYAEALILLDQLLQMDPKNEYAQSVRPLVEDRAVIARQRTFRERFDENAIRQFNDAEERKTPYNDILRFPDLTGSRDRTVATERGLRMDNQQVTSQLERRLPEVSFDSTSLADAVEFMRDVSGANIFVDWKQLESAGVKRDTPVTARLQDVKFGDAIGSILTSADGGSGKIGASVEDGVIAITTGVQTHQLGYANASDVARRINNLYRSEQRFVGGGTVYGDVSQSQTRDVSAYSFGNRELGISGSNGYGLTAGRLNMKDAIDRPGVTTTAGTLNYFTQNANATAGGITGRVDASGGQRGAAVSGTSSVFFDSPVVSGTGGLTKTGSGSLVLGSGQAGFGGVIMNGGGNITATGGTTSLMGRSGFTGTTTVQSGIVNEAKLSIGAGAVPMTPKSPEQLPAVAFKPTEYAVTTPEESRFRLRREQMSEQQAGQQSSGQANSGTLSTARSLVRLDFEGNSTDARQYNLAGDGTMTADSGVTAPIAVVQGSHSINAAVRDLRERGLESGGSWSISANWTKDSGNIAGTVPNSVTFGTMSTAPTTRPVGGSVGPIQIAGAIVLDPPIGPSPSAAIERTELALANTQQPPAAAQPSEGGAAVAGQGQAPPAPQLAPIVQVRRVIREGVMEFEVDSFDSAFAVVTKITSEEGGFVVAADSDRLANGKVRGAITVRVPPDNLDTLILKLRALGDLKSQRLGSKDISKDYTDLESELRAGRAMEERLLEMIKNAQGEVKDLLEAEKELATWRIRLEKIQGQMNYYNNLVSLATLTINAYEKDIRTPATATQSEEINAGIEAEDVDGARTAALRAIDEVKGRIIESSLQQMNAGQFAAKIVADVAPENAGQVVDRLRQIGRVARLDSQKKQTTGTGQTPAQGTSSPGVGPKIEQAPTRLIVSIYNLANVAARLTTNLNLAADDVELTYRAILARVNEAGGRVVSSKLDRQDANQVSGTIQFEVKTGDADAVLNDIRQPVQVLRLNVTENPDTANVTTTKQGFTVQIIPTAQVTPRLTTNLNLAAEGVEATYTAILNRIRETGGRVITSNLNRQDATQATGTIQFELRSGDTDPFMTELRKTVQVLTLNVNENTGAANLTGLKQGFSMQIIPAAQVNPREVRSLAVQTSAVDQGIAKIQSAVASAGGRVLESSMSQDEGGAMIARLVLEVPMDKLEGVTYTVKAQGTVRTSESSRNAQVPDGPLSRGRINLTIGTGESKTIVPATGGFWDTIRGGLSTSIKGLLWSLQLIIIGICLIGPWVLIVWGGAKWYKRNRRVKVEPTT